MIKLLSIISLILAIVLFPPAALALISNNAVPGDATYPIKRGLEDGIYALASLNPVTKAWFSAARSDRRFKEVTVLLAEGKAASNTLTELVSQTQVAAVEIKKINDPVKKKELINQLSQQIEKYDQGLSKVSKRSQQPPNVVSKSTPSSIPQVTSTLTFTPRPRPTFVPTPTLKPTITPAVSPKPSSTPNNPTSTLRPTSVPTSTPSPHQPSSNNEVEGAQDKLDDIREELEKELGNLSNGSNNQGHGNNSNNRGNSNNENNSQRGRK